MLFNLSSSADHFAIFVDFLAHLCNSVLRLTSLHQHFNAA